MTEHLLRIEAVNLDQVLADTDQLSVIRGGGLLALAAVRRLDPEGREPLEIRIDDGAGAHRVELELVSGGASVGLYRYRLPDAQATFANRVVECVSEQLAAAYPHHNFVVDSEPLLDGPDAFHKARERLIARNRLRQLRQPTPVLTQAGDAGPRPCEWDDLRPAAVPQQLKPGADGKPRSAWLSASVHARYQAGREQKQRFLDDTTGLDLAYTEDFETLAGAFPRDRRLQNKLAVLYFDGNHFGKLQAGCASPASLQAFDHQLRTRRILLLRRLLNHLAGSDDAFYTPDEAGAEPRLRFELLLWGGDELLFVVPAWLGLDALCCAYRAMADWTWQDPEARVGTAEREAPTPLTHAGALIFCDRKTPIDRMTQLARDLAEHAVKDAPGGGRDRNLFEYLILESIDFPAEAPTDYLCRRYPALSHRRPLSPVPDAAASIQALAGLRDAGRIPHGPLHEGALRIARGGDCGQSAAAAEALVADLEARAAAAGEAAERDLAQLVDTLARLFAPDEQTAAWRWVHLAELWDYLGPRRAVPAGRGA
ncbi:hypothetical protein CKO31_19785 [Thiohalocapsa halophila]|uniref:Uncharacterized protein n=1 Tax=Thiohalocapsa halophila TaxID=69359 RepID=A0ABS1CM29_9GAMM|nr:hypothetical protein [Thiohalocapsa halophila]MBK1632950.1 hypothetical protein [Thiohalocapsa halophila]